jgi:hypothetical protein
MAKLEAHNKWAVAHGSEDEKAIAHSNRMLQGKIGILGISASQHSMILGDSPEHAAAIMRWDLENPWSRVYQMMSTHPLTALRVKELNAEAGRQGQPAAYELPQDARLRWTGFALQFALWAAPFVLGIVLLSAPGWRGIHIWTPDHVTIDLLAAALLIAWLARINFRYQGEFKPAAINELISDTAVSQMLPRAVRIEGEIVGRANAEAFWSPDLVIKDDTGFLFVLDRQSIAFARLWAATKADSWTGAKVTLEGWYRRGMMPYVELYRLTDRTPATGTNDGSQFILDPHRSYSRWIQVALAIVVTGILYGIAHNGVVR